MAEFLLSNMWALWLIAAAAFVALEAVSGALISIWFVPGAVITSVMSIWVKNFTVQIIVFVLLSAAFLFFCKKYFKRNSPDALDDTSERYVGKTAVAKTDISETEGKVLLGDVYWRAVSKEEIKEGESVLITAVNGNIFTVDKK